MATAKRTDSGTISRSIHKKSDVSDSRHIAFFMPDYLAHINKSYPFPCLPHMEGAVEAGLLISFLCLNVGIYEKCSKFE